MKKSNMREEYMTIRKAAKKDIPKIMDLLMQIHDLHAEARPDIFVPGIPKYSPEEVEAIMAKESSPIFVAADEKDEVLGYAFCIVKSNEGGVSLTDIKTMFIDDLCVDEKCRGQGIGKELVDYVAKVAKEYGCYNLTLNVWNLNDNAIRFYEKCGMKPMKTVMEKKI